jgi:hypothetical protein
MKFFNNTFYDVVEKNINLTNPKQKIYNAKDIKKKCHKFEESKKKISQKNKGKVRSEQAKQNYRKPKTSEHAEKIRQANLGRPRDSRYEKISLAKQKQKWYNNGIETRMFEPGKELNGFVLGRKLKV